MNKPTSKTSLEVLGKDTKNAYSLQTTFFIAHNNPKVASKKNSLSPNHDKVFGVN